MTCDTNRPCYRCFQRGLQDSCEDAPRKRKKYLSDVPTDVLQQKLSSASPPQDQEFQSTQFQHSVTTPFAYNSRQQHTDAVPLLRAATNPVVKQEDNMGFYSTSQLFNESERPMFDQKQSFETKPPEPQPYAKRRTNFLSSAADLEYLTLSNILLDNFMYMPNPSSTSAEQTPNSVLSPALSPHHQNVNNPTSAIRNTVASPFNQKNNPNLKHDMAKVYVQTPSPHDVENGAKKNIYHTNYPHCDESINQYFLGSTGDQTQMFPDIIEAIQTMKEQDPAVFQERNSKLALSFALGVLPDENLVGDSPDNESCLHFKEPEEIYAKVVKPFSYTPGYHSLIAYLRKRFPKQMLVKMAESIAAYRPSFIACTNSLKEGDLIFMEQCFQRTLLTYDNFIRLSGTPTIVWRRTGEIAYVGHEFSILTGWTKEELIGKKRTFIVELLDDTSVVEYFQLFLRIAFGDFLGATMTECLLLTPKHGVKIRTGCMWTLKRDVFGIPMMIIGNFLPII